MLCKDGGTSAANIMTIFSSRSTVAGTRLPQSRVTRINSLSVAQSCDIEAAKAWATACALKLMNSAVCGV